MQTNVVAVPTAAHARPVPPTDGALALKYVPEAPAAPRLHLVRGTVHDVASDAKVWSGRIVQALAEALAGDRPIAQLVRWVDPLVYSELHRRIRLLGLTTTASGRGANERSSIRSVHLCMPADGIAEVAAHIRHGDRSRAMALRLERRRNRWICTALHVG